ncbi:MAG: acyl-CoA thioesterase [Anaerolineae bacterium]|nr:acyl-CoA thioesterase [Anaerolineae bacterium]
MPLTHVRTFRVRHYECDAYGHVNYANYLRYMQETAFDASAAAGYDLARYQAMGCQWLIRETDIEYLHPLRYGDSVQVKTWVADFRRIRSLRAYEFRLAGSGELVARAHTDWVFLDSTTLRPTPIPRELMVAFFPEGPPDPAPPRPRFPPAPPPPPGVFRLRRRVEWRDLDPAQHVNNAVYLSYLEDCGVQVAAAYGWPMSRMQAEGWAVVARRLRIEYRQPAVLDDELELATWVSNVKRSSAVRHYIVTRVSDGALLARARTLWVWVDLKTGRPIRIPRAFLTDFAPNIV